MQILRLRRELEKCREGAQLDFPEELRRPLPSLAIEGQSCSFQRPASLRELLHLRASR